MAIVQCMNNHYYDDSKDSTCPYCAQENYVSGSESGMESQTTSYYSFSYDQEDDGAQVTEAYGDSVGECDKTIGIFSKDAENEMTAGWLVCRNGFMKGKSYVIHEGRNFAGRSYEMDLGLSDDPAISRKNHFSIVYEPKSIMFYIVSGEGRTYLNGEAVTDVCELEEGDRITAGESDYIFVPFCRADRIWQ
ncbi:MAG: FHA domain-containing protein [Lachnospiraceae bacterium]|nr:FHA domain-containing protein [Lachnospiraceae bacterium]